jgi:hypothetical protein
MVISFDEAASRERGVPAGSERLLWIQRLVMMERVQVYARIFEMT